MLNPLKPLNPSDRGLQLPTELLKHRLNHTISRMIYNKPVETVKDPLKPLNPLMTSLTTLMTSVKKLLIKCQILL